MDDSICYQNLKFKVDTGFHDGYYSKDILLIKPYFYLIFNLT